MNGKNRVLVKINGQEYPIVGAEPKEYLLKVGSFVDDKMEAVAKSNKQLSTSMIAVLTCINITDQYLKLNDELGSLKKDLVEPQSEINKLEKYIDTLHNHLTEKDEAYLDLEKRLEEVKLQQDAEGENPFKDELLGKNKDLEKAQDLINDLQNKLFENQIKLVEATKKLEEYIKQDNNLDKK